MNFLSHASQGNLTTLCKFSFSNFLIALRWSCIYMWRDNTNEATVLCTVHCGEVNTEHHLLSYQHDLKLIKYTDY